RGGLHLSLFSVCGPNYGVPLEFSSRLSMVSCLHTYCRLTDETARLKSGTTAHRREQLAWALAAAFLLAAIAGAVSYWRLARVRTPVIVTEIVPPENTRFNFSGNTQFNFSGLT